MKIRFSWLLPVFLYSSSFLFAQKDAIQLENPSFEDVPEAGARHKAFVLEGWIDCGFPGESAPDIHGGKTNFFNVVHKPYDGNTFLGMIVRQNGTWESVTQKLTKPLLADSNYSFSIFLCNSQTYISHSPKGGVTNYNKPVILRIFGGSELCQKDELLAVSPIISHLDWRKYDFNFSPKKSHKYIILEAFYSSESIASYAGNLLLDNASNIALKSGKGVNDNSLNTYIEANKLEQDRFEFSDTLMGTSFRIVLYADSDSIAQMAAQKAFARIQALDSLLSDYREDSEVSLLANIAGKDKVVSVSDDLYTVLSYALEVSKKSDGAFDATAGALTKLWRRAFRQKEMPPQAEISAALETVGHRFLKLYDDHSVRLLKNGTHLDLGGIAKGYAVDEAMKILKDEGITSALVDGGGDIATSNPPPGEMGWLIDKYVYNKGKIQVEPLVISNQAIATSGDTYRYLEWEGVRYSHIIDPRTGMGVTSRKIVTVTAPTCMEADAWATAMSVEVDPKAFLALEKKGISVSFSLY